MSDQRISRLMARFEETTREEATTANQGHAQASNPPTEQGRDAALTAGAPHDPIGQVVEGEDKEDTWTK